MLVDMFLACRNYTALAGGRLVMRAVALFVLVSVLYSGHAKAELPDVIERVKPSVVIIGSYKATNSPRFSLRGTGFVVGDGNQLITNAHVLQLSADQEEGVEWVVQIRNGHNDLQMRRAAVVDVDKRHDLALLRFEGNALAPLSLKESGVREGQSIAFTGFPIGGALGFSPVTHRGMISSITPVVLPAATGQMLNEKSLRSLREGSFDIFQLDATAYPGNSGGPLFDAQTGEVLGIVNMVFVKGTKESALSQPSGISYAVPAKYALELLQRRKISGSIR